MDQIEEAKEKAALVEKEKAAQEAALVEKEKAAQEAAKADRASLFSELEAKMKESREDSGDMRGIRVIYLKQSSRQGWIGTIQKSNKSHVWIDYDNGCNQRYSSTALEWLDEDGYIMKLEDHNAGKKLGMNEEFYGMTSCEEEAPRPTLKTAEYLVVIKNTGKVLPFFNEEDAEQFCAEQITTSHNMQSFAIFKYDFEMTTKAPEVVKSVRKVEG